MYRKSLFFAFAVSLLSVGGALTAQFVDDFSTDPAQNDWVLQGNAVWVAPDAPGCADPNDPGDPPCSLYEGQNNGYVLVTAGANSMNGSAFRAEKFLTDDLQISIEIEVRDGTIDRPADGMTVVSVHFVFGR